MKSTAKYYQEVIEYLMVHRNARMTLEDQTRAMYRPSEFLKIRHAVDKILETQEPIETLESSLYAKYGNVRCQEDNPELTKDIERLMRVGRKIPAIKVYRAAVGTGLKEAKDAVEEIEKKYEDGKMKTFFRKLFRKNNEQKFQVPAGWKAYADQKEIEQDEEDDERANRLTTEILKKSKEMDELFDELAQCDENEAEKVRELINEN